MDRVSFLQRPRLRAITNQSSEEHVLHDMKRIRSDYFYSALVDEEVQIIFYFIFRKEEYCAKSSNSMQLA